jgi:WD40 repeat protein
LAPEQSYIVAGFADGRVILIDWKSGEKIGAWSAKKESGAVQEVALSPRSDRLLSVAANGVVRSWATDAAARAPVQTATLDANLTGVKISPNAHLLAGGTGEGVVKFYQIEPESGKVLPAHSVPAMVTGNQLDISVTVLSFSPDSTRLLAATSDLDPRLYRLGNERQFTPELLPGRLPAWVSTGAFSADGERAIAGLANGSAFIWGISDHSSTLNMVLRCPGSELTAVKIGNQGRWAFTGGADGTVRRWDISQSSGADAEPRWLPESTVVPLVVDGWPLAESDTWRAELKAERDGRTGNSSYRLVLSNLKQPGQPPREIPVETPVETLAFSPDGSRFAYLIGKWDEQADLSNFRLVLSGLEQPGRPAQVIPVPGFVWSIGFSPDNRRLAYATRHRVEVLALAADGSWSTVFQADNAEQHKTHCIAMSPDGRWLAVAGLPSDTDVRVWDLPGQWGSVLAMTFTPDSQILATGSYGGAVLLWRRFDDNRWDSMTLPGYQEARIRSLAVEPQGATLRSRTRYGVTLWTLDTDALLKRAQQVARQVAP